MADETSNPSRYVKLTKELAPMEDIKPGELNQPIDVPQVICVSYTYAKLSCTVSSCFTLSRFVPRLIINVCFPYHVLIVLEF